MLSNGETVEMKLQRIAEKARQDPRCTFTSLFPLMDVNLLRGCFARLRRDAAAGIDQVTKEEYQANLEENLRILVDKLNRVADKRVLRYTERFLKAGIMEDGALLDRVWQNPHLKEHLQAHLVRYADDFVVLCRNGVEEPLKVVRDVLERLAS